MTAVEDVPLGDIVYNWLLLKLNQVALELRDLINDGGFGVLVNPEQLQNEIETFLGKENNGPVGQD